jgi:hypothetical protein
MSESPIISTKSCALFKITNQHTATPTPTLLIARAKHQFFFSQITFASLSFFLFATSFVKSNI